MINLESQSDNALNTRAIEITRPEFIQRVVHPLVTNETEYSDLSPNCTTSMVQDRGTGRITVLYRFDDGVSVFGKLYSDGLGIHSYRVNRGLWEAGFNKQTSYQVPQPLSYLPQHNLLLTMGAEGVPLMSFIGQESEDVLSYARRAAHWLVRLHQLPLRIGRPDTLWDSMRLHKILRRLTKAAAAAPHDRKRLITMVDALCETGKQSLGQMPDVQAHGRYHYEHIFVNGAIVSLIDFDRSLPSAPAKDLAEFLMILRHRTFKLTGNTATADTPSRVFLEEYFSVLPTNVKALTLHWGAFVLEGMFKYVKRFTKRVEQSEYDSMDYERRILFFAQEFDTVLSRKLMPVQ